jgi:hypothetical protein
MRFEAFSFGSLRIDGVTVSILSERGTPAKSARVAAGTKI